MAEPLAKELPKSEDLYNPDKVMDAFESISKFKELQDKYGFIPELHILGIHVMKNYIRAMATAVHQQRLPVNYKELISVYEQ